VVAVRRHQHSLPHHPLRKLYFTLNPAWFALGYVPEIRRSYDEGSWMVVFRHPGEDPRELMPVTMVRDIVLLVQ